MIKIRKIKNIKIYKKNIDRAYVGLLLTHEFKEYDKYITNILFDDINKVVKTSNTITKCKDKVIINSHIDFNNIREELKFSHILLIIEKCSNQDSLRLICDIFVGICKEISPRNHSQPYIRSEYELVVEYEDSVFTKMMKLLNKLISRDDKINSIKNIDENLK